MSNSTLHLSVLPSTTRELECKLLAGAAHSAGGNLIQGAVNVLAWEVGGQFHMFGAVENDSGVDFRRGTLFKHLMNECAESWWLRGFGRGWKRADKIWDTRVRKFPQGKHRKCRKAV